MSGDFAELKLLVKVGLEEGVTRPVKFVYDMLPDSAESNGWFTDKPEGFTVGRGGHAYVVTDNDGVDEATGETLLLRLGPWKALFRG